MKLKQHSKSEQRETHSEQSARQSDPPPPAHFVWSEKRARAVTTPAVMPMASSTSCRGARGKVQCV